MTTKKIYGPWIKWHGGECPVMRDTVVGVKFRKGVLGQGGRAGGYYWHHGGGDDDIVEYCAFTEQADLGAAEQLLCAHGCTVIPPAKPLTTAQEHADLAARNAAVIWLYQRAADQACINATFPRHVAYYTGWVEAQQTIANLAEELETSPLAWAEFSKWYRGGGV